MKCILLNATKGVKKINLSIPWALRNDEASSSRQELDLESFPWAGIRSAINKDLKMRSMKITAENCIVTISDILYNLANF